MLTVLQTIRPQLTWRPQWSKTYIVVVPLKARSEIAVQRSQTWWIWWCFRNLNWTSANFWYLIIALWGAMSWRNKFPFGSFHQRLEISCGFGLSSSTLSWWLHPFPRNVQKKFHLCPRRQTPTTCLMTSVSWTHSAAENQSVFIP
jgi:hypothetical protein